MENEFQNITNSTNYLLLQTCEIVSVVLAVCGIVANLIIIYVLIKIKETQHYYIYILNWCICNLFFLICWTLSISDIVYFVHGCIIIHLEYTFMLGNLIFVSVLTLDWYITTYSSQNCSYNCRKITKFTTLTTWILLVVFVMNSVFFCIYRIHFPVVILSFLFVSFCLFLLCVIVYVLKLIKKQTSSKMFIKSNLMLILVWTFVLLWLPDWISFFFESFVSVIILTAGFACAHSFIILILLIRYDDNFKNGFRSVCCNKENVECNNHLGENQSDSLI